MLSNKLITLFTEYLSFVGLRHIPPNGESKRAKAQTAKKLNCFEQVASQCFTTDFKGKLNTWQPFLAQTTHIFKLNQDIIITQFLNQLSNFQKSGSKICLFEC